MDVPSALRDIVNDVGEHVRRIRWTNEQLEEIYARRTPNQILADGHTSYMGTCPDLTSAAAALAVQKGLTDITFVIKELYNSRRQRPGMHFALQFNGNAYHLDFFKDNEVHIGSGPYNPLLDKDAELQGIYLIRKTPDLDKNLVQNYHQDYPQFGEQQLLFITGKLIGDNTEAEFQDYLRRIEHKTAFDIVERF